MGRHTGSPPLAVLQSSAYVHPPPLILTTITVGAVAPLSAEPAFQANKVPSGPPPSSCQASEEVHSPEQLSLVYTYYEATPPSAPAPGVYSPLH